MTEIELLSWLRGPGFQISVLIFGFGLVYRIIQHLSLGAQLVLLYHGVTVFLLG